MTQPGRKMLAGLTSAILMFSSLHAAATIISVNDWSQLDDFDNDVGTPLFRVTEVFTPAAENGGIYNRYEYQIENLTTEWTASLLSVGSVTSIGGRTYLPAPAGWNGRSVRTNLWETQDSTRFVQPGATLAGFGLETEELFPAIRTNVGWILAMNSDGDRRDVFGSITQPSAVPEPGPMALIGMGMLGLVALRRWVR